MADIFTQDFEDFDNEDEFDDEEQFASNFTPNEYDQYGYEPAGGGTGGSNDNGTQEPPSDWSSFAVEDLINTLHEITTEEAKRIIFKNLWSVDMQNLTEVIDEIRSRFPAEMIMARDLLSREQTIISNAKDKADETRAKADSYHQDRVLAGDNYFDQKKHEGDTFYSKSVANANNESDAIIDRAKQKAAQLVSVNQITIDSKVAAQQIKAKAEAECDRMIAQTTKDLNDWVDSVQKWGYDAMKRFLGFVIQTYESIINSAHSVAEDTQKRQQDVQQQMLYIKSILDNPPQVK